MNDDKEHLHRQLIKLGDMMGDGEHKEPSGKWIERDYRKVATALGYIPRRPARDSLAVNKRMDALIQKTPCPSCGKALKQTRSGSSRLLCTGCGKKFRTKRG